MNIPNIVDSLRRDTFKGNITLNEAAVDLFKAGLIPFVDTNKAFDMLSLNEEIIFSYNKHRCHALKVDKLVEDGHYPFLVGEIDGYEIYRRGGIMFNDHQFEAVKKVSKEKEVVMKLTELQRQQVYEEVKHEYQLIDLNQHIADMYEYYTDDDKGEKLRMGLVALTDKDKEKLIEKFNSKYDCGLSENDQWQNLILNYIEEE